MPEVPNPPDGSEEQPAPDGSTMDRRGFLRAAGMYSGSLAAGMAVVGNDKFEKRKSQKHHTAPKKLPTPPLPAGPLTLADGVTIPSANWVVEENKQPGTLDWVVSASTMMYGYCDQVSAVQGDEVTLYVDAPMPTYRVELYRAGFYQGLGGRLVWNSAELTGHVQPPPTFTPGTNMIECDWTPSLTVPIQDDWPPGYYVFKLIGSADGSISGWVPLIVRDDASTAAVVIMSGVTTAQAYNTWGGYSLYVGPGDAQTRSRVVSFDRPYDYESWGAPNFLGNEFPVVFLAESMGLDVTYITDIDLHAEPQLLTNHNCLVSLGHDEYWSQVMRTAADDAITAGVNVAFLGANAIYRHIRLEASPLGPYRRQVCYKTDLMQEDPYWGTDPAEVTADWPTGPLPRPEQTTIGSQYIDVGANAPMTIVNPDHWVFAGTGFTMNQSLPGVIFGEYDFFDASLPGPQNVEILAHSNIRNRGPKNWSDMTYYTRPGGGGVLATGNAYFIYRMSNSPSIYPNVIPPAVPGVSVPFCRMIENVFSVFGAGPASTTQPSVPNWQSYYA